MKNIDVPLWDKGDKTDDYVRQGGTSTLRSNRYGSEENTRIVNDLYTLVLNRKPTSSEKAYYKYIDVQPDEIIHRLINTQEHADLIAMGRSYPNLEEREKEDQTTIIKLKHRIEDRENEFEQMQSMLNEKNKEINVLREENSNPYIQSSFIEENGRKEIYYSVDGNTDVSSPKPKNWVEKLTDLITKILK